MSKNVLLSIFTAILLLLPTAIPCGAADDDGCVLYSDIEVYFEDVPIAAYIYDDRLWIMVEDLLGYGFDVTYYDSSRSLWLFAEYGEVTSVRQIDEIRQNAGKTAGYIYESDISTIIAGDPGEIIGSLNIGGYTLIEFDELTRFGDTLWDAEKRELRFEYVKPWSLSTPRDDNSWVENYDENADNDSKRFLFSAVKDDSGEFVITEENRERATDFGISFTKTQVIAAISFVGYDAILTPDYTGALMVSVNVDYDGNIIDGTAAYANEHIHLTINGTRCNVTKVTRYPGNNSARFTVEFDAPFIGREDVHSVTLVIE